MLQSSRPKLCCPVSTIVSDLKRPLKFFREAGLNFLERKQKIKHFSMLSTTKHKFNKSEEFWTQLSTYEKAFMWRHQKCANSHDDVIGWRKFTFQKKSLKNHQGNAHLQISIFKVRNFISLFYASNWLVCPFSNFFFLEFHLQWLAFWPEYMFWTPLLTPLRGN